MWRVGVGLTLVQAAVRSGHPQDPKGPVLDGERKEELNQVRGKGKKKNSPRWMAQSRGGRRTRIFSGLRIQWKGGSETGHEFEPGGGGGGAFAHSPRINGS